MSDPLRGAVLWLLRHRGRSSLPFYCDPARVGTFAVAPEQLAEGSEAALFRLFISLSMYQALRDVVIMRQQRSLSIRAVRIVADLGALGRGIERHPCSILSSFEAFEEGCDVWKGGGTTDCRRSPGLACHVKEGTRAFNRMGDMGKLPTSAWLRFWRGAGLKPLLEEICRADPSPTRRASLLVEQFAAVHRVGRKLATLFVSALSTPPLAPRLTPWFPRIDGNELVVIDTNVAQAVDALRPPGAPRTYDARAQWVREQAAKINLSKLRSDLPPYSPRLVQEALYAFCSKSNRVASEDVCASRRTPCAACIPKLCPFMASSQVRQRARAVIQARLEGLG